MSEAPPSSDANAVARRGWVLRCTASVRGRLTLWAFGVFVVLVVLASALVLGALESALYSVADRDLREELEELVADSADANLEELLDPASGPAPDWTDLVFELRDRLDTQIARRPPAEALRYEIRRAGGALVGASPSAQDGFPRSEPGERRGGLTFRSERPLDAGHVRIVEAALGPYRVQVARELGPLLEIYAAFRTRILVALVTLSLAAAWGGFWIATRALQPVRALVSGAERLRSLAEGTLPRTGAGDEIDSLAGVLNDLLARLRDEVGRVRQFTADAAHEIRTPLTSIRGHLEILLSKVEPAHQETLAGVLEEVERLTRIVNQLLLLEKLGERSLASIERAPLDLGALARNLVEHVRVVADDDGIELVGRFERAPVVGDAERLHQLFLNLLDNALKHTPEGGRVQVLVAADPERVRADVCDSGPGIDPAERERIFDRFSSDRSQRTAGTGLGLPIARAIARAHGGDLRVVTPESGTGATLRLELPSG